MERETTQIKGFDNLIEGGFPKGASILLSGPCGSAKMFFASQFLYTNKSPSLYYTFENDQKGVQEALSLFDWKLQEKIKQKQFNVITSELYQFEAFLSDLEDNIEKTGATRVAVDSLTVIGQFFDSPYKLRKSLIELKRMIKNNNATAIFISEVPDNTNSLSTFGAEEFVLDGLVRMHLIKNKSEINRALSVRKMLATHYKPAIHPLEVTRKGIVIHKIRELL